MSFSNYKIYNDFKNFKDLIKGVYVCKDGDTITGDIDMTCNDILNIKNLLFCDAGKINGDVEFTNNVTQQIIV
jgi:hypothetical protein